MPSPFTKEAKVILWLGIGIPLFGVLLTLIWLNLSKPKPPTEDSPAFSNHERAIRAGTRYLRTGKQSDLESAYMFAMYAFSETPTSPSLARDAAIVALLKGEKDEARRVLLTVAPHVDDFFAYAELAPLLSKVGESTLALRFYELAETAPVSPALKPTAEKILLTLKKEFSRSNTSSTGRQP